jgi:hypothetical protein
VTAGGSIGDGKHSFGVIASATGSGAKGNVNFQDKTAGKHLKGAVVTGVACSGNEITVVGTGTVGGAAVSFVVRMVDNGEPGTADTFAIAWSGGDAYSNSGTLTTGNVQAHS